MIDIFKKIVVNVFGTSISQIIPFLTAPIVLRIYSPSDFGIIVKYLLLMSIFASLSTLKLEHFLMIKNRTSVRHQYIAQANFVKYIFAALAIPVFAISYLDNIIVSLIGAAHVVSGTSLRILQYEFMSEEKYEKVATLKILTSVTLILTQIILGLVHIFPAYLALIIAFPLSQTISVFLLKAKSYQKKSVASYKSVMSFIKENFNFIFTASGTEIADNLVYTLPQALIAGNFGHAYAGAHEQSNKLLLTPSKFVSNGVMEVFYSSSYAELKLRTVFIHAILNTFISIPIFLTIYYILLPNINYLFGEEWIILQEIVPKILPFMLCAFIFSPLKIYHYTMKTTRFDLTFNLSTIILVYASSILATSLDNFYIYLNIAICTFTILNIFTILACVKARQQ